MRRTIPVLALLALLPAAALPEGGKAPRVLDMHPPHISRDAEVKYDYDIVYVRAPRKGDKVRARWAEVGNPRLMEPGSDLVLLRPDGSEEVLVPVKPHEAVLDPFVSFDGKWVYYAKLHDARAYKGADIYKVHVASRKVVQLTAGGFTPNTGAASWKKAPPGGAGVYNLGPCPLPGGRVVFVSDRNAFKATNPGYTPHALALQLFTLDDDTGSNVECIGHLNLGSALHPVVLVDGRVMFSSLESQGLRSIHLWGLWAIHPDGSRWGPLFSAFEVGNATADSAHFQTQLSDGSLVVQSYYNLNNFGFGTYYKFPAQPPEGYPAFGPAFPRDPRNPPLRHAGGVVRFPFSPHGLEALTPFVIKGDYPSAPSVPGQEDSPRLGKFTHPSAAPDNHLLTAWSPGSVHRAEHYSPPFDSGIYLIKSGRPVEEPGQMLLIKNDPRYHEQWPRALVPYRRIYGVDEPRRLPPLANDGKLSRHLPEGSPFGLVGTSSLYKRETYPYGVVPPGSVTATFAGKADPSGLRGHDTSHNWTVQGADAGLYDNADIHAVRFLVLEPTTENGTNPGQRYYNHAHERMRILGELPVRKFPSPLTPLPAGERGEGGQPTDPDGNPDTSFLAKLPADVAWTFQTLDKDGMVLNMSQTWHQLRPGEVRTDCGGCHAHSQLPTPFAKTFAARPDYSVFDLTSRTPLLTTKARDESGKKWDVHDQTGLRFEPGVKNVEFHRDVEPILQRSCVPCHTQKAARPPGNLVLDDDRLVRGENPSGPVFPITVPGTYARLAADPFGKYGHKPLHGGGWREKLGASRYVKMMQSRRSLLVWKLFGRRTDGWQNDDLVHEAVPGDPNSLRHRGRPVADTRQNRERAEVAYTGGPMPPPEAVAGTYVGPDGKKVKVPALTDEERRTVVRWIDLGCPIDLDFYPTRAEKRGKGWMLDDNRPTLTVTHPRPGENAELRKIVIGMHDYYTGLDLATFQVRADFAVEGVPAGKELAGRFRQTSPGVWEMTLARPIRRLGQGTITVSVRDREWNLSQVERTFRVRGR